MLNKKSSHGQTESLRETAWKCINSSEGNAIQFKFLLKTVIHKNGLFPP